MLKMITIFIFFFSFSLEAKTAKPYESDIFYFNSLSPFNGEMKKARFSCSSSKCSLYETVKLNGASKKIKVSLLPPKENISRKKFYEVFCYKGKCEAKVIRSLPRKAIGKWMIFLALCIGLSELARSFSFRRQG